MYRRSLNNAEQLIVELYIKAHAIVVHAIDAIAVME